MPSSRRNRQLIIIAAVVILFLIYLSRDTTTQSFYSPSKLRTIKEASKNGKPIEGSDKAQKPLADLDAGDSSDKKPKKPSKKDADERDAEKDSPDSTSESSSTEDTKAKGAEDSSDDNKSVAGRKKMKNPKSKEERLVEAELNQILKRSPVIIFSKTTCPYSAKAKRILLSKYSITPRPHVVELDKHALGAGMQNMLEKTTGRRTVPNVLINGKSIGGGDDIEAAEIAGTLVEKIQNLAGKRITKLEKLYEGD